MRILQRTVPTRMLNIACNAYHLVVINYWSSEVVQPEYFLWVPRRFRVLCVPVYKSSEFLVIFLAVKKTKKPHRQCSAVQQKRWHDNTFTPVTPTFLTL
jgi:hypothetical protein